MAADPRTIMRALKAVAPAPSTGGYGNNPAPYIGPGPSPLVASYNESYGAHQYGTNAALPRDWRTFLSGMFGPLDPIRPVPIDIPPEGAERPGPRRFEYPISYNMPGYMPGTPGLGRLAGFSTLRSLCDLYSVARNAINLRKNELRSVGWDIAPTRQAAKAMRGDHKAVVDFEERRAKVVRFFRHPDPNFNDFTSWFFAILEEFFVTDAISLYIHPSRAAKKGLLGSNIAALDIVDGATIKPLLSILGGRPTPPSPAYQQFEFGVPRVELMTPLIDNGEEPLPEGMVAEYRRDQLMYLPFMPRVWSPYGFAPIEGALVPIITGINKQQYAQDFYREGSIPGLLISAGDSSLTPSQLRELQDAVNALAGDQAWKHKVIVLPSGSKADPMRPGPLADDFDLLVQTQTTMGFDVMPFELGISAQVSIAASSSGAARQVATAKMDLWQRKSTIPTLLFFKSVIFDTIIQEICGQDDMEWSWEGLQDDQNIGELTPALVEQVGSGLASIDEARLELGREPWGLPITSDPGWATQWGGLVPLTGVTEATAQPLGGSPGPGGPGRAAARPGGAQSDVEPTGDPGLGAPAPATVPRNRMSSGQRRQQAQQVTSTQNSTGSRGTPAHSGARSAGGLGPVAARSPKVQRQQAAKAIEAALTAQTLGEFEEASGAPLLDPERHAIAGQVLARRDETPSGDALRELGLLKSHLKRGGTVGGWAPRDLPGHVLAMIDQDMAAGLSADYACGAARAALDKSASGYTLNPRSGMISLDLPEGTLEPLPGGVADHHITICYLGPDVDDAAFGAAAERVREAAAMVTGPLTGTVGIGSFPASASSDGKVPVFAEVSLPGASILRAALADLSASEHTEWHAHVTLCYQDEGDPLPAPVPPRPVTFTHLTVHRGTDAIRHALGGQAVKSSGERAVTCGQGHKHWGTYGAAGLLIRAKGADGKRRYLLQQRGEGSDHAGTWGLPGGALHEGETPAMGAVREATEELGVLPNLRPAHTITDDHGNGWAYSTIVCDAPSVFQPHVDGATAHETAGWAWLTARQVEDHPLHPGFERSWRQVRLSRRDKAVKDAADLTDPNPVDAEHVRNLMRGRFPESALSWVPEARWIGPVQIPQDRVNDANMDSWRASRQPQDVKHYAKRVKHEPGGVPPVVMVQVEGESRADVVDGHHRVLAYRKLGLPVKAYVGMIGRKDARAAMETHSSQIHDGEAGKSERTPVLSTTHNPLGTHSLWRTPDRHTRTAQSLPDYIENVAHALEREGRGESEAIALAIASVKAWAAGHAFGGKVRVTPEVQAAAQRAVAEWSRLKASHH